MKISIALLAGVLALDENVAEVPAAVESTDSGEVIAARFGADYRAYDNYDSYGDYYYDDLGNKKKKNQKPHHHHEASHHGAHVQSSHNAHSSQAAWSDSVNTQGAHFGFGKGFQFDQDLIGNGRFCWNCYARLHHDSDTGTTTTAYDNCFGGIHDGFMEMCVGEEYFCQWEERRYKGVIIAVSGGCKSAHSCLRQMTENFRWRVFNSGAPTLSGNLCRSGNFGDETENSVCAWCCDGHPTNLNRFAPDSTMLCNHKDFTHGPALSPAHEYFANSDFTDNFVWNQGHGANPVDDPNDLFNGLYKDGQFHGLFRIHDQYPLGHTALTNYPYGSGGPDPADQIRSHPRGWAGKPAGMGQ